MENNSIGNAERNGKGVKFERIRRITGYLVGAVDRWIDAKKQSCMTALWARITNHMDRQRPVGKEPHGRCFAFVEGSR